VKLFDVGTMGELAKLLAIAPFEITEVVANRCRYYRIIKIPKSNGKCRVLHVPEAALRTLQEKVKHHILDRIRPLDCVHGGVFGRSVITNALPHVGKEIVFALDIQDFFPSVHPHTVTTIFEALGFRINVAEILAAITTWNGQVPQGAPTSTSVANLSMARVDVRLGTLAKRQGFSYTRYVDDLTLSGNARLLDFRNLIVRIVDEEGFCINPKKVRTMHSGERQVVTRLIVNSKLNIAREQRKEIRQEVIKLSRLPRLRKATLDSVRGRVSWVMSINPVLGFRLRKQARITG
jgi:RNA-directed DNA polymerase